MRPARSQREREAHAAHVSAARRAVRLTQAEIAEALGVGVRTVHRWERGFCRPPDDALRRLVNHLATFDRAVAAALHEAVGGAPLPAPPAPSTSALDALVIGVADALDCAPRRARDALPRSSKASRQSGSPWSKPPRR